MAVGTIVVETLAFLVIDQTLKTIRRKKNMKTITFDQLREAVSYSNVRDTKLAVKEKAEKALNAVKAAGSAVQKVMPVMNGSLQKELNHTDRTIALQEVRLQQIEDILIEAGMLDEAQIESVNLEHVELVFQSLQQSRQLARKITKKDLGEIAKEMVQEVEEIAEEAEVEMVQPKVEPKKPNGGGGRRRLNFDAPLEG